ncbi:hypothetical protein [Lentilactobacillus laojiaonis]|uniref:hypothetical protein n=1 Tax=Lentilactobacillus laojiaonis TaxID=2883998 RepID=UPI001D0AA83C|nr:hypothetical protein [Lentilactobacillus laojiaonis]UDM32425.1 hypothetical protein LHL71_01445 [Lentilactobacillus laojiaonis]
MDSLNDRTEFQKIKTVDQMVENMELLPNQSIEEVSTHKSKVNDNLSLTNLTPFHIQDEILGVDSIEPVADAIYVVRDLNYDNNTALVGYQKFDDETSSYIESVDTETVNISDLKRDVNFYPNLDLYSFTISWANDWVKQHIDTIAKLDFSLYVDDNGKAYLTTDGPDPIKYNWQPLFEKMIMSK